MTLSTRKQLGQHWLTNLSVVQRMVQAMALQPGQAVIEIGPGTGVLTRALLASGAHVTAIELDPRCWPLLEELGATHPGQFMLIKQDALTVAWPTLLAHQPAVCGNLPYNVGTEIVVQLLSQPVHARHLTFMLQKEVIQRICATPVAAKGNRASQAARANWGRLGVLCHLLAERQKLFDVAPSSFSPPPKVVSSVVQLTPLPAPRLPVNLTQLDALLRLIFGQRRKMLRSLLPASITPEQLATLNIQPTHRAENLTTQQLCQLAALL